MLLKCKVSILFAFATSGFASKYLKVWIGKDLTLIFGAEAGVLPRFIFLKKFELKFTSKRLSGEEELNIGVLFLFWSVTAKVSAVTLKIKLILSISKEKFSLPSAVMLFNGNS